MADPVTRDQFDADLTAELAEQGVYIGLVNALLALPQVIDLAAEDAQVATAMQAVRDAEAQLPPPPPKPAK